MSNIKRLSSILTFPYKYIVPLIPIGLTIFVNLTIDKEANQGYFIPLNLFFLACFLVCFLPFKNLKKVEYDNKHLFISNFIKTEKFQLEDIIQVKRSVFFFYNITIRQEHRIRNMKFLSPARERMFRPLKKLNSITELEIKKIMAVANKGYK